MSCYSGPAVRRRTGERAEVQSAQPPTPATAGRAARCLKLIVSKRGKNQCESEQAPGYDMCPHHIAEAARDYEEILAEAARALTACAVCQNPMDPVLPALGYRTHPCCDPDEKPDRSTDTSPRRAA